MRKIVLGLLLGAGLTLSFNVYAAVESLIGKQIQGQFPVKVEGKALEQQAAVVDGTSYLPVRAIGDALNMDVSFNAELGIELKKREVKTTVLEPTPVPTLPIKNTQTIKSKYTPEELDSWIEDKKVSIQGTKMFIESGGGVKGTRYAELKALLDKYESELVELEKQKAALQP